MPKTIKYQNRLKLCFLYWFSYNIYLKPNLHTYSENSTWPNIYDIAYILSQKFAKKDDSVTFRLIGLCPKTYLIYAGLAN